MIYSVRCYSLYLLFMSHEMEVQLMLSLSTNCPPIALTHNLSFSKVNQSIPCQPDTE